MNLLKIEVEIIVLYSMENVASSFPENTFRVRIHGNDQPERHSACSKSPYETAQSCENICACFTEKLLKFVNENRYTRVTVAYNDVSQCFKEENNIGGRRIEPKRALQGRVCKYFDNLFIR